MEYTYETLLRCNNCRFEAECAALPVHGIVHVRGGKDIYLFFNRKDEDTDWILNSTTLGYEHSARIPEGSFERESPKVFSNFKITPRAPETYKDWQVGDKVRDGVRKKEVLFRSGQTVLCKLPNEDVSGIPMTCTELFSAGYRLVLTDVEKEILAESEDAEKNAEEDMHDEVAEDVRSLIAKELDGYTPKGKLEGFPIEIIAKMLERQYEQTGKVKVKVFEEFLGFGKRMGGFTWGNTIEGKEFWGKVLAFGDFRTFFERYPKENRCQLKRFDAVLVRDKDEDTWVPAIFHFFDSSALYPFGTFDGIAFKHCAPLNEATLRYLRTNEQIPGAL